jgi:hypothetical protein
MSGSSTSQQLDHALVIGASNHVDGDFDRTLAIRKSPVSHLTRDERSIRHNDFRTVRGANDTGPDADAADLSHIATYLDDVTDFNRTSQRRRVGGDGRQILGSFEANNFNRFEKLSENAQASLRTIRWIMAILIQASLVRGLIS